jgi:hypothetical protein
MVAGPPEKVRPEARGRVEGGLAEPAESVDRAFRIAAEAAVCSGLRPAGGSA